MPRISSAAAHPRVALQLGLMLGALGLAACTPRDEARNQNTAATFDSIMNPLAEQYVRLVLAVGEHDGNYVDAYYGPPAWRTEVQAEKAPLDTIAARAAQLLSELQAVDTAQAEELVRLRQDYLTTQVRSLQSYTRMLKGERMRFDEESRALYDAVAPTHPESEFQSLLDSLSKVLPGNGPVAERLARYRSAFVIPKEKVDTVFRAAIAEARRRTAAHVTLPADESFTLEYVTGKSWSGYNWYQGNLKSLIQINTDLPIFVDRAVDLGAHEGYPGHHVYNLLLEHNLVRARGWPEYQVYPLFSPQSLIAEGSANYGIEVAFPGEERLAFERDVLFALAGLDPARAAEYARIRELTDRLGYAGNEAARKYLNGEISADSAAHWLTSYALMEPERARQRVRFIDTYRSYVINYNYGKDMVRDYVEQGGASAAQRWQRFKDLLSSPRLPSTLK
ncbi:MAG: hypothetical protein ACRENP_24940 [Longimicrobiales bacterium]